MEDKIVSLVRSCRITGVGVSMLGIYLASPLALPGLSVISWVGASLWSLAGTHGRPRACLPAYLPACIPAGVRSKPLSDFICVVFSLAYLSTRDNRFVCIPFSTPAENGGCSAVVPTPAQRPWILVYLYTITGDHS